jgi:hypothetical protein
MPILILFLLQDLLRDLIDGGIFVILGEVVSHLSAIDFDKMFLLRMERIDDMKIPFIDV